MRSMIISAAVCLSASTLFAQGKITPLDVKTGLWQSTVSTAVSGSLGVPPEIAAKMTPEQRARAEAMMKQRDAEGRRTHTTTTKHCVTEKDLQTNPFAQKPEAAMKCVEHVLRSNGHEVEVRESCAEGTSKSDMHLTFHAVDSEHVTGKGDVTATMGGRTMHSEMNMAMKWLGTCSEAEKKP